MTQPVRCPHCQRLVWIEDDPLPAILECPACHRTVHLATAVAADSVQKRPANRGNQPASNVSQAVRHAWSSVAIGLHLLHAGTGCLLVTLFSLWILFISFGSIERAVIFIDFP